MPTWPLPGVTSAPSAVSTRVAGAGKNRDGRSAADEVIANANGPPSLDASASVMVTAARSCSARLSRSPSTVPELMTAPRELRSCGRPSASAASSSSTSGWQTALPATTRVRTRCADTVSQTCLGSSRPGRAVTTRPPTSSAPMQLKRPVACIRGTAGIITGDRSAALASRAIATASSSVAGTSSTPTREHRTASSAQVVKRRAG